MPTTLATLQTPVITNAIIHTFARVVSVYALPLTLLVMVFVVTSPKSVVFRRIYALLFTLTDLCWRRAVDLLLPSHGKSASTQFLRLHRLKLLVDPMRLYAVFPVWKTLAHSNVLTSIRPKIVVRHYVLHTSKMPII